jgi:hypothetical protein
MTAYNVDETIYTFWVELSNQYKECIESCDRFYKYGYTSKRSDRVLLELNCCWEN